MDLYRDENVMVRRGIASLPRSVLVDRADAAIVTLVLSGVVDRGGRPRPRGRAAFLLRGIGLAAILCLLAVSTPARADGGSPFFQVTGAESGVDALPLKSTHVEAMLTGVIAEVCITQTYCNEGSRILEARYVFPGSTRAAVHAMAMTIGSRRIEAQVHEKAEARRVYETAKKAGQTAALLEAERSNIFEMNVANILPGDVVTVELRYSELLLPTDGEYEWVFPTTVGPRYRRSAPASATAAVPTEDAAGGLGHASLTSYYTPIPEAEPVFTLGLELATGVPPSFLECVSHHATATESKDGRTRLELPPAEGPAMNRDFILRYRLAGDAPASGLLVDEWRGEKYFLLTVQPPARIEPAWIPPRDYVFVVDVSGSMHGFPLNTAKAFVRELLMDLRPQDTFNVVLFAGTSRLLSPVPLPATPEAIAAGVNMLQRQNGGGGTELLPALARALDLPKAAGISRSLVCVTDGFIDLEAEAYAMVRNRLGEANLFAIGIGSSVNRELIKRLARAGRAEPAVITGPDAVTQELARFQSLIVSPVLTHLRAEFDGFGAYDTLPPALPDLLAQRPVMTVGKWSGPARGIVRVKGIAGEKTWEGAIDVSRAVDLGGQGLLARLWARERLDELEDLHALSAKTERELLRQQIVELGLNYNLLTRFTSFVAVDVTPRASTDDALTVHQPNAMPAGMALGEEVPTTPEPETFALIAVAGVVGAWKMRKRVQGMLTAKRPSRDQHALS